MTSAFVIARIRFAFVNFSFTIFTGPAMKTRTGIQQILTLIRLYFFRKIEKYMRKRAKNVNYKCVEPTRAYIPICGP